MTTSSTIVTERTVYAGMLVCITMLGAILWVPSLLGALHDGYGLGTAQLSRLAFAELFGFLSGTLFTSDKTIVELRRWVLIGCAVLVAVNCTLVLLAPQVPFIVMRPLAGFGSGIGFDFALKLCSASARPTRSFGILTGAMSVVMIIGFQFIAYLIDTHGMRNGAIDADGVRHVAKMIFGTYIALAAVAAVVLLTSQPPAPIDPAAAPAPAHGMPEPLVLLGLLAVVLSFIGQGAIWAFLQTLGTSHGFTVAGVANAMSAFAILGIVGSLTAAVLPLHLPRWIAISGALLVLWAGLYALYAPVSLAWYIGGCAIGGFYWNFILPLMLGILARIDQSGRGSVLGGTMSSAGSALGPLLAGMLIQGSNYQPVGWLAGMLCGAGLVCVMLVENRSASVAPVLQPS